MKVTPDIICHEFIGTEGRVVRSSHASYVGLKGMVVDETKNTFIIFYEGRPKQVVKNMAVFHFKFPDNTTVEIDGKLLVGRPEDRLKKGVKRLW